MLRTQVGKLLAIEGLTVGLVLLALVIVLSIASPFFLRPDNIENVLVQSMFVLIVALGITFVLITGGIDLSVGSVMGLSAGVTVYALISSVPVGLAIPAGLLTGAVLGFINGLIITRLGISDFIVTLAMLAIARGVLQLIAASTPLRGIESETFSALTNASVAGIALPVIIAAVIVVILAFVLTNTSFGRSVFAIGINRRAAHLSGIDVAQVRLKVYVLSGLLAAAAGILLASRLSSVQPGLGTNYELTAIAAAVIGGTSLAGGRGTLWGTVIGALILGVLENGLRLLEVSAFWFTIVTGVVIVLAVIFDQALQRFAVGQVDVKEPNVEEPVLLSSKKERS
jgi:ribose/xylose/arabinose/galactoside ABC-type transport system permease subunit